MPHTPNILIIDDDAALCALLAEGLENYGHACRTAAEPGRIAPADWQWADIVLVDLKLGAQRDGAEVLRRMRMASPRPRVALMSGHDSFILNAAARAARDLGYEVIDTFAKPVSIHALARRLHVDDTPRQTGRMPPLNAAQLSAALEAGEIGIAVQPRVDLATGACVGVEVVARWESAEAGVIQPARFVPLGRETGLIGRLTDTLLDQSLALAAGWARVGRRPLLALELPAPLMEEAGLVERLNRHVARRGLAPENLLLELTETALISPQGQALETALRLRLAGYGLALSDFGSGENRYERLVGLPLTVLKLDPRFTEAVGTPHGLRVVQGTVAMARALNMTCVADGIVHPDQGRSMRAAGCTLGQGRYLGCPVPARILSAGGAAWSA